MALAAQADPRTADEALALAAAWLEPATSVQSASQTLPRGHIVRALDAALSIEDNAKVQSTRAMVVAAPEPGVYVAGGDDFF